MFNITINLSFNVNIREYLMIPAADDGVMATLIAKMEIRQMVQLSRKFDTPLGHSDSSFKIT